MSLWKKFRLLLPWHRDARSERVPVSHRPAGGERLPEPASGGLAGGAFVSALPEAHLDEDEETFTLTLGVPGYAAEDLEVSVEPDRIVIGGERIEESGRRGRSWSRREGRVHLEVPLAAEVVQAEASAKLELGVLTVRVPKTEGSRRRVRRIPVGG